MWAMCAGLASFAAIKLMHRTTQHPQGVTRVGSGGYSRPLARGSHALLDCRSTGTQCGLSVGSGGAAQFGASSRCQYFVPQFRRFLPPSRLVDAGLYGGHELIAASLPARHIAHIDPLLAFKG